MSLNLCVAFHNKTTLYHTYGCWEVSNSNKPDLSRTCFVGGCLEFALGGWIALSSGSFLLAKLFLRLSLLLGTYSAYIRKSQRRQAFLLQLLLSRFVCCSVQQNNIVPHIWIVESRLSSHQHGLLTLWFSRSLRSVRALGVISREITSSHGAFPPRLYLLCLVDFNLRWLCYPIGKAIEQDDAKTDKEGKSSAKEDFKTRWMHWR